MRLPPSPHLRLEVVRHGKVTALEVDRGAILVGTGSHCDVRLLLGEAAPEHLRIQVSAGRASARVLARKPACLLDGRPFHEGELPRGCQLSIGDIVLRCRTVAGTGRRRRAQEADGLPPAVQVAAVLLLLLGFKLVLDRSGRADGLGPAPAAPELFPDVAASCPVEGQEEGAFEARRSLREAELRRERSPYNVVDGLSAVRLYETAKACFAQTGSGREARDAGEQAARLRAAFVDEYRVRRARLERLLARGQVSRAQLEILVLQDFLRGRAEPYSLWLGAAQRLLSLRLANAKESLW